MIELVHKRGPFGDCSSNYEVLFPEGWTVADFVRYVAYHYAIEKDEWGRVYFGHWDGFLDYNGRQKTCSFYDGISGNDTEKSRKMFTDNHSKKLIKVEANGGWSNMDYYLFI